MGDELPLFVSVNADEWAYLSRRLRYLESLVLRVVRNREGLLEWQSAADLEALRLPGLPASRSAIARKAAVEKWARVVERGKGGLRFLYHVSALPPRAFDALVARILDLPPMDTEVEGLFDLPAPPLPEVLPSNTAPAWVLPLMRIMRTEGSDIGRAWRELRHHTPEDVTLPDPEEAARVLIRLGLA
ncbi:DNA-binding protein [Rhodobacter capsulatus]|uniref:Mu DNA-binding domain-containing protein n=1 Tax=Rhodobacter capsulatus TaxID=1061 RepID=A0A1G7LQL5_RHOCA|nr:DNA-binding protein [Rhodobacter capsulatus]WER10625.1 DNA-binding protein [Rhodobacter capsulatus]SDF51723.1 Mu DNA-binding domain-containing protein [Rhodobacter capsulatus]